MSNAFSQSGSHAKLSLQCNGHMVPAMKMQFLEEFEGSSDEPEAR